MRAQGGKGLKPRGGPISRSRAALFFLGKDEVAGGRLRHYGPRAGQNRIF
jgi:hypothetical protein